MEKSVQDGDILSRNLDEVEKNLRGDFETTNFLIKFFLSSKDKTKVGNNQQKQQPKKFKDHPDYPTAELELRKNPELVNKLTGILFPKQKLEVRQSQKEQGKEWEKAMSALFDEKNDYNIINTIGLRRGGLEHSEKDKHKNKVTFKRESMDIKSSPINSNSVGLYRGGLERSGNVYLIKDKQKNRMTFKKESMDIKSSSRLCL